MKKKKIGGWKKIGNCLQPYVELSMVLLGWLRQFWVIPTGKVGVVGCGQSVQFKLGTVLTFELQNNYKTKHMYNLQTM